MMVTLSCPPRGEGDTEQEGDVGLQLMVKFTEKAVVRNSRVNGKWGTSESILSFFPFAAGESFKVRFCLVLIVSLNTINTADGEG